MSDTGTGTATDTASATETAAAGATTRRREATRQKLLDAAAEVFAEVGVDAASVEAVCERAGFTRGAFYSNFETKDELMLALTERVAEAKIASVTRRAAQLRATESHLSPSQLIERMLDAAFDSGPDVLLTSEIRTRALRDPRFAPAYLAWQSGIVDRVARNIEELGEAYALRLRLSSRDFATLILQTWEDTTVDAKIAGESADRVMAIVKERTSRIAAALIDPA